MAAARLLRPLFDRVIVQKLKPTERTSGGLVLPESAQERSNQARVVAVGPGPIGKDGNHRTLTVKAGDRVLLGESYGITEVKVEGQEYHILREADILAVFNE